MPLSRRAARVVAITALALATANCDATSVFGTSGAESVSIHFDGDTVLIVGAEVQPQVRVESADGPVTNARIRMESSDSSILAIEGGLLRARGVGTAEVRFTLQSGLFGQSTPRLVQPIRVNPNGIAIQPAVFSFTSLGDWVTFSAFARDAAGQPTTARVDVSWTSSNPDIATVSPAGVVTSVGIGIAEIHASFDASFDTMTAIAPLVVAQRAARFRFTPTEVQFDAIGADTVVSAVALDGNGNDLGGAAPIWESRDASVATVSSAGLATARGSGVTYLLARRDAAIDSLRVEVRQLATQVEILAPAGTTIDPVGGSIGLTTRSTDRLGAVIVNAEPRWASLDPAVVQVAPDRGQVTSVTALVTGTARVRAWLDAGEQIITLQVTNTVTQLVINPDSAMVTSVGDTHLYQVSGRNSLGQSAPLTGAAWSTPDTLIARVAADGRASSLAEGTARIIATWNALADTALFVVRNVPASIVFTRDADTLRAPQDALTAPVEIRNARGALLAATAAVWTSSVPTVASVSASGVVTALAVGTTTIRAASGSVSDTMLIVVRNDPVTVVVNATRDTLTATGQSLQYAAEAFNSRGDLVPGASIAWRSTNTTAVTVTSGGSISSVGYGTSLVIASAGAPEDTVWVAVTNPTRLHVDNSSTAQQRFGTLARPYVRIQDAIAVAETHDTIMVHRGNRAYAEVVALPRRITLLGDSALYHANGRDPSQLPVIAHESGVAAISASAGIPLTVRYLSILHSVDGPAIMTQGSDVRIDHVFVNHGVTGTRVGRGFDITDAPSAAQITDVGVQAVQGYGIRLTNVRNARVARAQITTVDAASGSSGAGIEISGGSGIVVEQSRVRGARGPQILAKDADAVRIADNDLAGRQQLVRVARLTGAPVITGNVLQLGAQPQDFDAIGSAGDGRSGLEVRELNGLLVSNNQFRESGSAVMDAVRLLDARGVLLEENVWSRGRHHVRSERSTWELARSRLDSALLPISSTGGDSITLVDDTLSMAGGAGCLSASGTGTTVVLLRGRFEQCGSPVASTAGIAVDVSAPSGSLTITGTAFIGANHTPIRFSGARLSVRGSLLLGGGNVTAGGFVTTGAVHAQADTILIAGNAIRQYSSLSGIHAGGVDVRVDSNRIWRNREGMRLNGVLQQRLLGNDISDNAIVGLENESLVMAAASGNWWGDDRGPRRDVAPAAAGDSVAGLVDFSGVLIAPRTAGSTGAELVKVRGDGQSGARRAVLPQPFTVRLVDAAGRPVAGVTITYTIVSGGGKFAGTANLQTVTRTTNASGLAEASIELPNNAGTVTISVSAPGVPPVTFTATSL